MSPTTKLALRRFALRWLRKLVDVADDRLHAAEVQLRNDLSGRNQVPAKAASICGENRDLKTCLTEHPVRPENYIQWEARRSGVAPISKKTARRQRQRMTAAAFDLRFAR
jgi:hypothetical protein